MARALPVTNVSSKCRIACSRDVTVSCSFWTIPFRVLYRNSGAVAAPLDPAFPPASRRMVRQSLANFIQAGFLTAGTRVEH